MKVLLLNGSAHARGNTYIALSEVAKQLEAEGIESEIFQLGGGPGRDCIGCGQCSGGGGCVFTDDRVAEFVALGRDCDGLVIGTPVYYAHPSGRVRSFLDRVFYSGGAAFAFKLGAAVAVARRAGTTASFDVLNKYFGISQMPVVSSTYWNVVHGRTEGEAALDAEGLQTMRNLARNMAWMLNCFQAGRQAGIPLPETERGNQTNFIR